MSAGSGMEAGGSGTFPEGGESPGSRDDSAFLAVEDLAVGYGRQVVLNEVSFRIRAGEFVGILGSNGSGKTTLLKTLLGILRPISGSVRFGREGAGHPTIGYVPQRDRLDPVFLFSAREVARMGLYGRIAPGRLSGRADGDLVAECLRETGVESLADKRFAELSGGQRQRVLIARALATQPAMLVLDEPTAGVDAGASQAITELLGHLNSERRMTVLMVNHELSRVRALAGRLLWLQNGRVADGAVSEMLKPERIEELLALNAG